MKNSENVDISPNDSLDHSLDNRPDNQDTTHFGFQSIPTGEKADKVAGVFHSVASKYDLMNDLMSLGIHRLWKRYTIEHSAARPGHKVLDMAGGTGDLAKMFSRIVGGSGQVVLSDINASMLALGRDQLVNKGCAGNTAVAQADAQYLPFADGSFDCITIGFGLRNVTDKAKALRSMHQCLKENGRLLVLEFSKPIDPTLQKVYDQYSFSLLPKIGKWIADDEESYRYLAESIRMHPDQDSLKEMILDSGYSKCEYHNFTGGIVALHVATK